MRPLCLPHSVVCGVTSPCALPAALQAFCRVAAVAGAVQVLRCPVEGPLFDEHTFSCIGVELGSGQVRVGGFDGVVFLQRGGAGQRAGEGRGGEVWGDASIHVWWLEVVSPEPWLLPTQLIPMPQHSLFTPRPRFIHSPHPTLLQVIRCQQLAAGGEFLQEWLATFHPGTCHSATHRCVAILDRPLVPGEHQSLLVAPPGALRGAVHAVRGVALSTGTRVCPEGR